MTYTEILEKINSKTLTCEDLDSYIGENLISSVNEKIRRRTQLNVKDKHIDKDGHQSMSLPNFNSRVKPKRKPSNNQKANGRGDLGRKHSAETVKKQHE